MERIWPANPTKRAIETNAAEIAMSRSLTPVNAPLAAACFTHGVEGTSPARTSGSGSALTDERSVPEISSLVSPRGFADRLTVSAPASCVSSHVLRSTVDACVAFLEPLGNLRCLHTWFHWNGAELVMCSVGAAPWSGLHQARVVVSLPVPAGSPMGNGIEATAPPTQFVEFLGRATSDTVLGVAPEHRAAAVRYLGSNAGHRHSDNVDLHLGESAEQMHRLFVTPLVPVVDSSGVVE